ncbi:MAG: hypothetical protein ACKVOH_01025, partial [Chlamydiales bacterium]
MSSVQEALLCGSLCQKIAEKELSVSECDALTVLFINLVVKSHAALVAGDLRKFDADVGDGGCQARAFALHGMELLPECARLVEVVKPLKSKIDKARSLLTSPSIATRVFVDLTREVTLSREMTFLLLSYMMTCTKYVHEKLPSGVEITRSKVDGFSQLTPRIDKVDRAVKRAMLSEGQARLSLLSIEMVQLQAAPLGHPFLSSMLKKTIVGEWK